MTRNRSCGALGSPHSTKEPKIKNKKNKAAKSKIDGLLGRKKKEEEEEESHLPLFKFHCGPGTIKTTRTMFSEARARLFSLGLDKEKATCGTGQDEMSDGRKCFQQLLLQWVEHIQSIAKQIKKKKKKQRAI